MAVSVMLLGSGCGVKTLYNNADRLARWAVSDYVSMSAEQRAYFDAEVDKLLYWHRTEHLPAYAEVLESMPAVLADGATSAELQSIVEQILIWGEDIEIRSTPLAVTLLRSLSDEQVARLPHRLAKSNVEWAEDEVDLTVEQAQQAWWREFADGFGRLGARLSDRQRNFLAAQAVRYLPQQVLWVDYRRRWQRQFLALLQQRHDEQVFAEGLRSLRAGREQYYGTELTAVIASNEALMLEVTVWLLNHLEDRQRERLLDRLANLATDLRELVIAAPETPRFESVCLSACERTAL